MKKKQKPLSFSLHPDNHAYIEAVVAKKKETNHRYNRSMYMDDLITHLRTKAEAKAKPLKKKSEIPEVVYPDNLNIEAWETWIEFRKAAKFKRYKSDATMKKLSKMGNQLEQMLIVQQSIDNEYQGLFELKGGSNGKENPNTSKKLSAFERMQKANSEYRQPQPDECKVVVGADGGYMGGAVDQGAGRATIEHVDNGTFIDYE